MNELRPVTSQLVAGVDGAVDVVSQVAPPGNAVTTYLVITRLPSTAGAFQLTVATPDDVKVRVLTVAVTVVGASGVVPFVNVCTVDLAVLASFGMPPNSTR